jgi:hypothetical protein
MRRAVLIFVLAATALLTGAPSTALGVSAAGPPSASPSTASPSTGAGGLTSAQAAGVVRDHGYTPLTVDGYSPTFDLSVIVGVLSASADGHPQQAFFFHRGQFAGTGGTQSANVRWVWSTGDVVALQFDLYRPGDPMCCPSAGAATVRYQWNGSTVTPLDPIPTSSWSAPTSRR